jgi:outer membrane protein OmpA-like peptidoglycan-associated protein
MLRSLTLVAALAAFAHAGVAHGQDADTGSDTDADVTKRTWTWSPSKHMFEAGVFLGGFLPSNSHEFYDPLMTTQVPLDKIGLDFGVRFAYMPIKYAGVETEAQLVPMGTDGRDSALLFGFRAHLMGQYPMGKWTPFAVGGFGAVGVSSDASVLESDTDGIFHTGVGVRYKVRRNLLVRGDARLLFGPKANSIVGMTTHGEILFGLSYHFSMDAPPPPPPEPTPPPDPDGDGIVGAADACPNEAGVEPDGCPVKDSDGDGILDPDDQCPARAEVVNGFEDADGCPDEMPDSDGDGMPDDVDGCKDKPEDIDGFEDADGCPDTDNDADGLLDAADGCPDQSGPVENNGCPDTDRDGDGVVDRLDNCPDEAGSADNQGCVKKQLVVIQGSSLQILDTVYFRTNKAKIRTKSYKLLNNVAAVLQVHPELTKIEVAGHTDDDGKDSFNQWLSEQRAQSVVDYLIKQGVAADRLVAVGYGETQPAVEGNSNKARKANRRVEFKVLESTAIVEDDGSGDAPEGDEPEGGGGAE